MKISEIPTRDLIRHLRATEQLAGKDSVSAQILRRELKRRRNVRQTGDAADVARLKALLQRRGRGPGELA